MQGSAALLPEALGCKRPPTRLRLALTVNLKAHQDQHDTKTIEARCQSGELLLESCVAMLCSICVGKGLAASQYNFHSLAGDNHNHTAGLSLAPVHVNAAGKT